MQYFLKRVLQTLITYMSGTAAIEGTARLPAPAEGAFLPHHTLDPQYGGALDPVLDNPGRIPGVLKQRSLKDPVRKLRSV